MTIQPGTRRTIISEYTRHECEQCGEPATVRRTFLLDNARRNPASKGYGKDDISWCSDSEGFGCASHTPICPDGMSWCSDFQFGERFFHLFHFWREVSRADAILEATP